MKKTSVSFVISCIIVGLVLAVLCFFGIRNSFVSLKEDVKMQQSIIETTLQRRCDLIPNLVATAQGCVDHENEVYSKIADARANILSNIGTGDMESLSNADKKLTSAIGELTQLLAISENYPQLESNKQFTRLMDELAGTENRITQARQLYIEKVNAYNKKVSTFPYSIIAQMSGFEPIPYYEADEEAQKVPEVKFN